MLPVLPLLCVGVASGASLERALDRILETPELDGAVASVVVVDDDGQVVADRLGATRATPASTVKWLTAVAAAEQLGLDWRFETEVAASGWLEGDTLRGDVVVVGAGDPSLAVDDPAAWIASVAHDLAAAGITRIEGDVVADAGVFPPPMLGAGWMWDDLGYRFSARFAGLNVGGNLAWAEVEDVCVSVGGMGTPLEDPPRCVARALMDALGGAGVEVTGEALRGAAPDDAVVLRVDASEPLGELLAHMLVHSDNLYAECVARALAPDAPFAQARDRVLEVVGRAGVDEGRLRLADGSGLSRYNLLAARDLVDVTTWATEQEYGPALLQMLPVAGRSGTLERRLKGTDAEGRLRGKTGSMSGVRNVVGIVEDAEGRPLRFAVLFTGFVVPQSTAIAIQDRALQILAISRRGRVRPRDLRALTTDDG